MNTNKNTNIQETESKANDFVKDTMGALIPFTATESPVMRDSEPNKEMILEGMKNNTQKELMIAEIIQDKELINQYFDYPYINAMLTPWGLNKSNYHEMTLIQVKFLRHLLNQYIILEVNDFVYRKRGD